MQEVSKTAQVLRLFAQAYGRPGVPRKRLAKLAYVADILSRQYLGRPLTELLWIKDHYGPYAHALPEAADELVQLALAEQYTTHEGNIPSIRLRATATPVFFGFTPGENEVLHYVVSNYMKMDLDEFIEDVVKESDPFKAAERYGDELPMDMVNGQKRKEIGFDLERILRAERQAAEGDWKTLADFAHELRTDITARYSE